MNEIVIFKAEANDNLVDKIRSNASIAYMCKVEGCFGGDPIGDCLYDLVASKISDLELLHPVKSVLVTTNWNRNDDVFAAEDTWAARNTPIHKPTNLEHDPTKIVGHITDTWVVSGKGEIIKEDTLSCNLPDLFHLCNGAVIYKYSKDEGVQEQADTLIKEIEAGTKFVSMECLFPAFDYAISSNDKSYVVPRTEETAFLTKHLRAYGGEGEYNGCRVGRLIKNMIFSGKGYVDTPANPDSIIFDGSSPVPSFNSAKLKNGSQLINTSVISMANTINPVWSNETEITVCATNDDIINQKEHNSMADELKNQLDEQKQLIADLRKANEDLIDQIADANVEKFTGEIEDLKKQLVDANEKTLSFSTEIEGFNVKSTELQDKIDELTKENETAKAEIAKIEAEKLQSDRVAVLIEGGLDKAEAIAKVAKFVYLSDEQFSEVAEALVEAQKSVVTEVTDTSIEEAETDVVLEAAEIKEDSANVGAIETDDETDDEKELVTAKAGISDFFSSKFDQNTSEDN